MLSPSSRSEPPPVMLAAIQIGAWLTNTDCTMVDFVAGPLRRLLNYRYLILKQPLGFHYHVRARLFPCYIPFMAHLEFSHVYSSCCSLGPAVLPGPVSNNWVRWCVGLQVDIGQSTVMAISFRYICTVLNWIKE